MVNEFEAAQARHSDLLMSDPNKHPQNLSRTFLVGLLKSIWKDLLWLNSFGPAVKIAGLIFGIAVIVGAWYVGTDWWMERVTGRYGTSPRPRLEIMGVVLAIILMTYLAYVIDRDRKSR